jgi:hypothetical protein
VLNLFFVTPHVRHPDLIYPHENVQKIFLWIKFDDLYEQVLLTREHEYACRLVTTKRAPKGSVLKDSRGNTNSKSASGRYKSAAK